MIKAIALIPARSGSKRVPNKNIRQLNGHPLIAYSIRAAIDSNLFQKIVCATDDPYYAEIAKYYGAEVPCIRPSEISDDKSSDFEWVSWILDFLLNSEKEQFDIFSILRPTSPFRKADTIKRAWGQFFENDKFDSIRAVEECKQHPGKMWVFDSNSIMTPLLPFKLNDQPWHSCQYASLPKVYIQNASLEIARVKVISKNKNISGSIIRPFLTTELEGFDLNDEFDWTYAVKLVENNSDCLPTIIQKPWNNKI